MQGCARLIDNLFTARYTNESTLCENEARFRSDLTIDE